MIFTTLARLLMQLNACINPFVYATSVPGFRRLAKSMLYSS